MNYSNSKAVGRGFWRAAEGLSNCSGRCLLSGSNLFGLHVLSPAFNIAGDGVRLRFVGFFLGIGVETVCFNIRASFHSFLAGRNSVWVCGQRCIFQVSL